MALLGAVTINPCSLLTKDDIFRATGWVVATVTRKTYHLPQERGTMCSYEAKGGLVVVTVPEGEGVMLGTGVYANPLANGNTTTASIKGAYAELFNNAAYIDKHHRHVVVKLLPANDQATPEQLTVVAQLIARRMP